MAYISFLFILAIFTHSTFGLSEVSEELEHCSEYCGGIDWPEKADALFFHNLVEDFKEANCTKYFFGHLEEFPDNLTLFHWGVHKFEVELRTLYLLWSEGVDFNSVDANGTNVLGYAVIGKRSVPFLAALIGFGADWTQHTMEKHSMIHLSASNGHLEALRFFLQKGGCDVNEQDVDGDTPLNISLLEENENAYEIVKLLLDHGADPNIPNKNGETALDLANKHDTKMLGENNIIIEFLKSKIKTHMNLL